MLLSWPVLALMLFSQCKLPTALIAVVVVPYLFLPEAYDINLPGLPDLDKDIVISLGLMLCLLVYKPRLQQEMAQPQAAPLYPFLGTLLWGFFGLMMLGGFLTVLNNGEGLRFGPRYIPPAQAWDAVSLIGQRLLVLLPFWCAARYFSHPDTHRALLRYLAIAVIGYSLLMLIEIRLSPQLHNWVYGYHQHSFLQHIRDGFRPKVFLQHGIWVGFLVFMGVMAAAALWRATRQGIWMVAFIWIFCILAISENLAALAIALMLLGVFFVFGTRLQRGVVLAVALSILLFPALRQMQFVPTQTLVSWAALVDEERAGSLAFRLRHEDALLARAVNKPVTGWGGWGRSQVYDENGKDISISEGRWIQTLSRFGWIGYIALFGLLTAPLLVLSLGRRFGTIPVETMALALIATGNLIYMIPNSTMTPVGLLVFGALAGFAVYGAQDRGPGEDTEPQAPRTSRYTRFGPPTDTGARSGPATTLSRPPTVPRTPATTQRRR